jgi:hypothetical protein
LEGDEADQNANSRMLPNVNEPACHAASTCKIRLRFPLHARVRTDAARSGRFSFIRFMALSEKLEDETEDDLPLRDLDGLGV